MLKSPTITSLPLSTEIYSNRSLKSLIKADLRILFLEEGGTLYTTIKRKVKEAAASKTVMPSNETYLKLVSSLTLKFSLWMKPTPPPLVPRGRWTMS